MPEVQKINNKNNKYPLESAGSRMVTNVPTAFLGESISDVNERLFEKAQDFETLNYIYVLDARKKLIGAFSLKEVFQKNQKIKINDLIVKDVVKVRPNTDQERVAILALKYNLKAIPVVDKIGQFLGVVPSDVILDILHTEDVEDMLRFAGVSKNNNFASKIFQASPKVLTKLRLPWLIIGLLGGLFAAQIVSFFEGHLKSHFVLAAFIPLIVYMADAAGTQTQTLFIRSLVYRMNVKEYFLKEIKVSFFIALILGVLLFLISYLWFGIFYISIILGLSLFLTIVIAFILGILIPFIFNKLKKDPAIASGPIGTIIRDILSLLFYFLIALLLLNYFA
jgi:magnesium transporter